jgi:hypothetical protein
MLPCTCRDLWPGTAAAVLLPSPCSEMNISTDRAVGRGAFPVMALSIATLLSACGDLASPADSVPSGIAFEQAVITVTEGDPIDLRPYIVDQDGNRIERLPAWVDFTWSTSDPSIFDANGLRAVAPGQTFATARAVDFTGRATVRVNPTSLAVAVPHAYMVQSVQRRDGSVPLVADRDAVLRIFATGDVINFFEPEVEVTFHVAGEEIGRERIGLTRGGSIPTRVDEGVFASSWALEVPARWVQPGLSFSVRLDPDGTLPVTNLEPARFPATGTSPVVVARVPDLDIRFVPIHQTHFGTTGSVSTADMNAWTVFLEEVFPIAGITRDVRSTFYSDRVTASGQTDWMGLIQEIWAVRQIDQNDRYYYGVLRQHGGYAGLGYVGWPVSIGWDNITRPAGDPIPLAYSTYAHEMGHNFGRWHAPACSPGNPDPNFPHPGGTAGVFGIHRELDAITRPSDPDLMGYCRPRWVSDYTWEGVLDFRLNLEAERRRWGISGEAGPALMVWGTVTNGEVRLEPAIAIERARPLPAANADLMVEGYDASGRTLFRHPAVRMETSHGPEDVQPFSAVVPLAAADAERLHAIRVTGAGVREGTRQGRVASGSAEARDLAAGRAPAFAAVARRGGGTELVWDAARLPLVVVREAGTGTVIALARNGRFELPLPADRLTFEVSDGVRSMRARPARR